MDGSLIPVRWEHARAQWALQGETKLPHGGLNFAEAGDWTGGQACIRRELVVFVTLRSFECARLRGGLLDVGQNSASDGRQ